MKDSRKWLLKFLIALGTLIPRPLLYLIYNKVLVQGLHFPIVLFPQRINLSIIIATFSFTTLGFLAAIITVLFGVIHSVTFRKYQKEVYLELGGGTL